MADDSDILVPLGLERMIEVEGYGQMVDGTFADAQGNPVFFADAAVWRALHHVIENEKTGAWRTVMKTSGQDGGRKMALRLDARLAALGKPSLAALPLEACLVFLERTFAMGGWGKLKLDLTAAAEHGLVVSRLQHSFLGENLPAVNDFADPLLAGLLQGFFEHISGQVLACEEIGCVRRGDSGCTFVITSPERLAPILPLLGREAPAALLARLQGHGGEMAFPAV
jgi:predicted hydrocarbon binding protein